MSSGATSADALRRAAAHVLVDDVGVPELSDDAQHHVFRVLRVRDGEAVTITDGAGRWRPCHAVGQTIEPVGDAVAVEPSARPLTIAFAVPKHDRPEWVVQKLTELGVERIVLLRAERSVVRWEDDRAAKHLERLQRVAAEAMQQSRGVWLPSIAGPVTAAKLLPTAVVAEPGGRAITADDRVIAIGPEGGWSANELELARAGVSLGGTVLRVETAAITAAVRAIMHTE